MITTLTEVPFCKQQKLGTALAAPETNTAQLPLRYGAASAIENFVITFGKRGHNNGLLYFIGSGCTCCVDLLTTYMSTVHQIYTTVLNGLPCMVDFYFHPPEPEVGQFTDAVEVVMLRSTNGKPAPWIEERLAEKDWEKIHKECHSAMETNYA